MTIRALLIFLCLTASASAEWISIDRFGGLVTSDDAVSIPLDKARLVDGWQVRNGKLERTHFTKLGCQPATTNPTYIVGQSATSNAVLYYTDRLNRIIDGSCDAVGYSIPLRTDSAYTKATTDSIIYNWEHLNQSVVTDVSTAYWLNYALTDRASIYWGDTNYAVNHFYSNRWIQLNRTVGRLDTLPLNPDIPTLSVTEGTGSVDYPDTTLLFDGNFIWKYAGQDDAIVGTGSTTFDFPTYADTGRVLNVYEVGDTLIMVLDPVDSIYTSSASVSRFWILWDDTLPTSHAVPCSILYVAEYSTDSMRCAILADSTKYKDVNHYWDGTAGDETSNMYAIMYIPGKVTRYKDLGQHSFGKEGGVNYSIDSLVAEGRVGPLYYGVWHTHFNKGAGVLNWTGTTTRLTDANIWEITTDISPFGDNDTCNAMLLQWDTLSNDFGGKYWAKFLLWDQDTILASEWTSTSTTIATGQCLNYLMYRPQLEDWSVSTTGATASNYQFAVLHRQRSWQGGNVYKDSATVMYSGIVNNSPTGTAGTGTYSVFPSANKLNFEGYDPITGLSSLGQTLAVYRRRGIQTLTGFAVSDFYTQPAPVGIGAVNHGTISRSVQDNADAIVNENGMFLFNGSGLEPLSPQVYELFSDSVNWDAEEKLRGAVWDNMYFVTAPFDTFTNNNRVVGLDLETRDAWTMTKPRAASVWNFKDDDGSEEMYLGDRDSSIIWQMNGPTDNLYYTSNWKSGWSDLGAGDRYKGVRSYRIEYRAAAANDTVIVDWYTDFSETAKWSDYIVSGAAGLTTDNRPVSNVVIGKHISYGIRSADSAMTVIRFGFDYSDRGEGPK